MDKLVKWINKYTELHPSNNVDKRARPWQPTCKEELWAYFGVLIHMGLIHKSSIEDYQGSLDTTGLEHIVKKYISRTRFKQLNCYFRCTELWPDNDPTPRSIFNRVNKLAEYIRLTYRKLYRPGAHLAVDETIERFMGRAPKIVNIPTKLIPEGFKIQVLANEGYILDWLQHARGDKAGLVNLDETFTEEGFLKMQAVVLDLLTQRNAELNEPLYPPGKHVVWLNNLFISVKLLARLQELGIRGAGTVYTTKTERKKKGGEEGDILVNKSAGKKKVKVPVEQINQRLADIKLTYASQIQWGILYAATSKDGQVMEFAWKDTNVVLFMSTVNDGK